MICGDGGFERGKNENLAVWADFENSAAAVAYKEVLFGVKRDSRGNAHAFHPELRTAIRGDAMDRAVVATGDVEYTGIVESQAGRIYEFSGEGLDLIIRGNLIERDGNLLPALTTISYVNVALTIYRRVCDRMKIFSDLHAKLHVHGRTRPMRCGHADAGSRSSFGNSGDEIAIGSNQHASFSITKHHTRPGVIARGEPLAAN